MTKAFSRLPTNVVPSHYVIKLKPDLAKFTFTGEVVVKANVLEPVTEVLCNASNLEVQTCSIRTGAGEVSPEVSLDQDQETCCLKLADPLAPGPATITYNFTGILNDKMRGFYRTKYQVEGEDRFAAVTQFEATDARQVKQKIFQQFHLYSQASLSLLGRTRCESHLRHGDCGPQEQGGAVQHAGGRELRGPRGRGVQHSEVRHQSRDEHLLGGGGGRGVRLH